MGIKDQTPRRTLGITTIPNGPGQYVHVGPFTIGASGATAVFVVTDTPVSTLLSLGESRWTITIDTDDINHAWPDGSGLSGTTKNNTTAHAHFDFLSSNDSMNIKVEKIYFQNTDSSSHSIWFYYKFYSQPNVASSGATQSI